MADYGLLAGLGEGLKAGIGGYQDAKRMALQQRQQEMEQQRLGNQQELQTTQAGFTRTPEGLLQPTPLTAQKQQVEANQYNEELAGDKEDSPQSIAARNQVAKAMEIAKPGSSQGFLTGHETMNQLKNNPVTKEVITGGFGLGKAAIAGQNAAIRIEGADTRQRDRIDERNHSQVVATIQKDPQLRARLAQFQNLNNAVSNVQDAKTVTPEQVDEFQQAVRSNLGIKGSGGVIERSHTYMNNLELASQRFKEYLSSHPGNIDIKDPVVQHFMDLAANEQRNITGQYNKELKKASLGHSSMYSRRPDLQKDLEEVISASSDQMAPTQAPQGLIKTGQGPQAPPQGLMPKMVTVSNGKETLMVPSDQAPAAAKDGYQVVQ